MKAVFDVGPTNESIHKKKNNNNINKKKCEKNIKSHNIIFSRKPKKKARNISTPQVFTPYCAISHIKQKKKL